MEALEKICKNAGVVLWPLGVFDDLENGVVVLGKPSVIRRLIGWRLLVAWSLRRYPAPSTRPEDLRSRRLGVGLLELAAGERPRYEPVAGRRIASTSDRCGSLLLQRAGDFRTVDLRVWRPGPGCRDRIRGRC